MIMDRSKFFPVCDCSSSMQVISSLMIQNMDLEKKVEEQVGVVTAMHKLVLAVQSPLLPLSALKLGLF
jgi:hypothetical protein